MTDKRGKGLGLCSVVFLLFLAFALVVIVGMFAIGKFPGRSSESTQPNSKAENPVKAEPGEAPKNREAVSGKRVRWSEVPDCWAIWPATGVSAEQYRGPGCAPTLLALLQMLQLDPEAEEQGFLGKLYTQWGLLNSIDYLLAKACQLEPNDNAVSNDRNQVPLLLLNGVRLPDDTGSAKSTLLVMLVEGFESVIQNVPKQHQADGLKEAFTTRAILLLSSLGHDPRTVATLHEFLRAEDPRIRSSAAFGLVLQGDSTAAAEILAQGEGNPSFRSLVGALLGIHRREVIRSSGTKVNVPEVVLDRSLDAHLLAAAQRHPANAELASCLAARLDHPDIRAYVTSVLLTSTDPATARSIVRIYPDLANDPAYLQASQRWFASDDAKLKHWGLLAMSEIEDPSIPSTVAHQIRTGDAPAVYKALIAQKSSVRLDPATAMAGFKSIIDRKMLEGGIALYVKQALAEFAKSESVDEAIKTEAQLMLRKMGGWVAK